MMFENKKGAARRLLALAAGLTMAAAFSFARAEASVPAVSRGLAQYAPLSLDTDRLVSFPGCDYYFQVTTPYAGGDLPVPFSSAPEIASVSLERVQPGSFLLRVRAHAPGEARAGLRLMGAEGSFPVHVRAEAALSVEPVLQMPELPSGCEIASLTALLRYYGLPAGKLDLTDRYLPIDRTCVERGGRTYRASPNRAFVGDPRGDRYGCFPPVIAETANRYLRSAGAARRAVDISGAEPSSLYWRVANGTPVLVWATIDMEPPTHYRTWYDIETGQPVEWLGGNHCLVLTGCSAGEVTMMDPLRGTVSYSRATFEERYLQHGKKALVLEEGAP